MGGFETLYKPVRPNRLIVFFEKWLPLYFDGSIRGPTTTRLTQRQRVFSAGLERLEEKEPSE